MMMGLADRVEAWARRLGIPPPPSVDTGAQRPAGDPATARAADQVGDGEAEGDEERFTREVQPEG